MLIGLYGNKLKELLIIELFYNIKNITFLKYWEVILSDVAVIGSGLYEYKLNFIFY